MYWIWTSVSQVKYFWKMHSMWQAEFQDLKRRITLFALLLCKIKKKLRYILCQNINRIIYCKHKSSWHNTVVPKKLIIELFFVECKVTIPMVFCFINFYSMSEAQDKETCVHQYIQCYLWGSGDSWWGGVLALPPPESGEWQLM